MSVNDRRRITAGRKTNQGHADGEEKKQRGIRQRN